MDAPSFAQSPFAALSFIAAPALLTNASSVLALSTINRMLRTRDRMHELFRESESHGSSEPESARLVQQVNRVEQQATLLLGALRAIYVALAAFASATLVTLLGASIAHYQEAMRALAGIGVLLGFAGVSGLVIGCVNLFRATQLSLLNIREEAGLIRMRHSQK